MELKKKFSMTLAQPELLRDSIKVLSGLFNEARLHIGKDGLKIIEMDSANVGMAVYHLLPSACVEYETRPEPFSIGINLENLLAILKNAKKSDILVLSLDVDKEVCLVNSEPLPDTPKDLIRKEPSNNLNISLKGSITRNYTLPLIDIEERENKIPNLEFKAKVKMPSDAFADAVKEADTIAESVIFEAIEANVEFSPEHNPKQQQTSFIMSAEGDLQKLNIPFREDENTKIEGEAKAKYSIEYLKKMSAAKCLSDDVILEFGTDYPLRLTYRQVDRLSLSWILAPRVEND